MNASELEQIVDIAKSEAVDATLAASLRRRFPGRHFTVCMDDDVCGAKPIRREPTFNVYLVSAAEHCIAFTQDLAAASGVVIAERLDDETE